MFPVFEQKKKVNSPSHFYLMVDPASTFFLSNVPVL